MSEESLRPDMPDRMPRIVRNVVAWTLTAYHETRDFTPHTPREVGTWVVAAVQCAGGVRTPFERPAVPVEASSATLECAS